MGMEQAVRSAVQSQPGLGEAKDSAAVELALTYARAVDDGDDLTKIGPSLLSALDALLLTPRARAAALRKGALDVTDGKSPLDELRSRRARRDSAPAVDTAAAGTDA